MVLLPAEVGDCPLPTILRPLQPEPSRDCRYVIAKSSPTLHEKGRLWEAMHV